MFRKWKKGDPYVDLYLVRLARRISEYKVNKLIIKTLCLVLILDKTTT